MKNILRALAALAAVAGIAGVKAALSTLLALVGVAPVDVPPAIWAVISAAVVAVANWLISKLPVSAS